MKAQLMKIIEDPSVFLHRKIVKHSKGERRVCPLSFKLHARL